MGSGPSSQSGQRYFRDHDEVLMQRGAALQGIDEMRFRVGPKSDQLTAIGSAMQDLVAIHSW